MSSEDNDRRWAGAKFHTLRMLRRYPKLLSWHCEHGEPDEDPAHREIVKQWHKRIGPYVDHGGPYRQTNDRWHEIVDWATDYLAQRQEALLDALWHTVTQSAQWTELSPSAQWLYHAVHAVARERDRLGGKRVLLSNRVALRVIVMLGGPAYRSLGIVTHARAELATAQLLEVRTGQKWEKGKLSSPTRYILPVDESLRDLNYPPSELRDSSKGSCNEVPRLTREQRTELDSLFAELRRKRDVIPDKPFAFGPNDEAARRRVEAEHAWLLDEALPPAPAAVEGDEHERQEELSMNAEKPPTTCPEGHTRPFVIEVMTVSGGWWPVCTACLSTPVPSDAAEWSASVEVEQ